MTDEQIDSILSAEIDQLIGNSGEAVKTDISAKTPLELQVNSLCLKIRNSKQPPSAENWVEAMFDYVESLLGKDKVLGRCLARYYILYYTGAV